MSINDVIMMMIGMDTKKAKDAVKDLNEEIEKTEESTEKAEKAQKQQAQTGVEGVSKMVVGFAALVGVAQQLGAVFDAMRQSDQMGLLAADVGYAVEEMAALDQAVQQAGGSAGDFAQSAAQLGEKLTGLELGQGGDLPETLSRLGISAINAQGKVKSLTELMPELQQSFKGLDTGKAQLLGARLGLDASTIRMLRDSKKGVADIIAEQKKLGSQTQKDADAARKFSEAMTSLKNSFDSIYRSVATAIAPALTWVANMLKSGITIFKEHETGFKAGIAAIALIIGAVMIPSLASMAVAAWAAIAPFLPFILAVGALGAAIALVVDDFIAFKNGGDSMIGRLLERFPFLRDVIKSIGDTFKTVVKFAKIAWENIKSGAAIVGEFLGKVFAKVTDAGAALFEGVFKAFEMYKNYCLWVWEKIQPIIELIKDGIGAVADFFGWGEDESEKTDRATTEQKPKTEQQRETEITYRQAKAMERGETAGSKTLIERQNEQAAKIQQAQQAPTNAISSQAISNQTTMRTSNTNVNVGGVTVDARGGDSQQIAGGINAALGDSLDRLASSYDDGVLQ